MKRLLPFSLSMRIMQLLLICGLFVSCSTDTYKVYSVMKFAGENRQELMRVVKHYRKSGDRLKLRACKFLIANMGTAYSLEGASLDLYYRQLDSFYRRTDIDVFSLRAFNDSLFATGKYFGDLERKYDAQNIGSEYLIQHIDCAFEAWDSPWARHLGFDDFCEYLLPYRIGNEVVEDWHAAIREEYGEVFDSLLLHGSGDPAEFCLTLSKTIPKQHTYNGYPSGKPTLKPSSLRHIVGGSCDDYCALFIAIARTFGVPVASEFTPQWGNHSKGHSWCAVIDKDGNTRYYAIGAALLEEGQKKFTWRLAKAYRRTVAHSRENPLSSAKVKELPKQMRNRRILDVTDKYVSVADVDVAFERSSSALRYAFLAVFNDAEWIPVCGARLHGRTASFEKMGYPCVYLPMLYENKDLIPAGDAFLLADSTGKMIPLKANSSCLRTVHLLRKFLDIRVLQFADSLRGGHFELADNASFKDALCLNLPADIGFNYQSINVPQNGSYRYIRYVPKMGSSGNISEIEVYDKHHKKLQGKAIGTYYTRKDSSKMSAAFDENPLTFVRCTPTDEVDERPWIGLDFGQMFEIGEVFYLPRSDDNFIRDGEVYELCYWNDRWVSLGKKVGNRQSQEIVYDNVPDSALLLLHNLSKGKEERIFTYENGKQIWW